ncbi:hypothetical protein JDN40_05815 [Rhodomicrobium vannielii ATCC 17100]|uniref:hypothetical protein n=1 Tax=Rhodomicrobium vannielii TaxID=1069 RepID=UPI00191B413D|nr:hypothetical protein [Rhodomicrobium vannielii]MBJ7533617.1 hypothetical protein [Rhodomicrobium vannielii ATCC 17100]
MTDITNTGFAKLEAEGRLMNPILKAPTHKAGRFGFRGDIALKFAPKLADEARPPELKIDQVMAVSQEGETTLSFFTTYLHSFEYLKDVADALGDALTPSGKYFLYCNNIDISKKFRASYNGITFYILPIDEAGVYAEILDLLYLDKQTLKKKDTAGKLDAIADAAASFDESYPEITYEEGLGIMLPVRNKYEHRPV